MRMHLFRTLFQAVLLAGIVFVPALARAQGGQGSFGGGSAGRVAEAREGDPASYHHIMTPGDRGEWPLTGRAGETVLVFVTSTTFDPAAQIVD